MRTHIAIVGCIVSMLVSAVAAAEKIALTFDDLPLNGALAAGTTEVDLVQRTLPILQARNVVAFGFVNARKLEANPNGAAALRLWVAGRQRIGNHSYSHVDLNTHSIDDYGRDILRNEPALELLSAGQDWRWFRYPYLREGDVTAKRDGVRAFLHEHRYRVAQTTIDYEDYLWNTPYARCAERRDTAAIARLRDTYLQAAGAAIDASRDMARRVFGREVNHVLLLHLGAFTPEILPDLLTLLDARGFDVVTLEEAQVDPLFQSDPRYLGRRGGTLLEQHVIARGLDAEPWLALPRAELEAICR